MSRTQRSTRILGPGTGVERLTRSAQLIPLEPIHYPVDEERENAQLEVVHAALDGHTEGSFYAQGEQLTTAEEAAQRTLSPGKIILDSFPYRSD